MRHNSAPDSYLITSFLFRISRTVWSVFATLKDIWLIWKFIFIKRIFFKFYVTLNLSIILLLYWIYSLRNSLSEAPKAAIAFKLQ